MYSPLCASSVCVYTGLWRVCLHALTVSVCVCLFVAGVWVCVCVASVCVCVCVCVCVGMCLWAVCFCVARVCVCVCACVCVCVCWHACVWPLASVIRGSRIHRSQSSKVCWRDSEGLCVCLSPPAAPHCPLWDHHERLTRETDLSSGTGRASCSRRPTGRTRRTL